MNPEIHKFLIDMKAHLAEMKAELNRQAGEADADEQATAHAQWAFEVEGRVDELIERAEALTQASDIGPVLDFLTALQAMTPDVREASITKLFSEACSLCGTAVDANEDCPACSTQLPRPKGPLPSDLFRLVPLASLPESTWRGRAVFHPCGQQGNGLEGCQWLADDLTGIRVGEEAYDVGVVESWAPDPDFADLGIVRVRFVGNHGSRLSYSADNLWTPAEQGTEQVTAQVTEQVATWTQGSWDADGNAVGLPVGVDGDRERHVWSVTRLKTGYGLLHVAPVFQMHTLLRSTSAYHKAAGRPLPEWFWMPAERAPDLPSLVSVVPVKEVVDG